MTNGRCAYHGGRTPSGKGWHRPRWPKADTPNAEAKLNRKLRDLDRAARKRERRLEAMTPEERQRHQEWQHTHKPGPAAARTRAKAEREAAADLAEAAQSTRDAPQSPELAALDQLLDEARRQLAALENDNCNEGIFG